MITLKGSCIKCGKVDDYAGARYCKSCKDRYLRQMKDYLYEHKTTPIEKIGEILNVPNKLVDEFLNEDRFNVVDEGKNLDVSTKAKLETLQKMKQMYQNEKQTLEQMKSNKIKQQMYFIRKR